MVRKKTPPPIALCRFEELAERENRLRAQAARDSRKAERAPPPTRKPR